MSTNIVFLQLIVLLINSQLTLQAKQPHIIFIMADDLGWNDVGFHGSGQIPTPNIDALAYSGLILNNYYVSPLCSPSRSALMTGKYPIHTGMQHYVLLNQEPRGLPINERLLPEYLRSLGYATHMVGKWHLGSYKNAFTPTQRGFDTFLGYLGALQDYFDHTCVERSVWGLDMRRGLEPAWDLHGKYSTDIFTDEAVRLIETHNSSSPMFLYLSHAAVHHGNPYSLFPVPDDDVERVKNVDDNRRRRYAAIMLKLDDSVGQVVEALHRRGILNDSVIVFASDNGGLPSELKESAASNWPLRGAKFTLWEGGVRAAALVWSTKISQSQRVANQLMHISDWLPTLYGLAGGNSSSMGDIDGVDMWESLSENKESSRSEVLHNIDDLEGTSALRVGEWKIVKGAALNGTADVWFGPSGREYEYDIQQVLNSQTAQILDSIGKGFTVESALQMRNDSDVHCKSTNNQTSQADTPCDPLVATCLFNVHDDPCEYKNLAEKYPEILQRLQQTLSELNATAIPPGNRPLDPRADPKYWNYTWTNFGDYLGYDDTTEPVPIGQS